MKMFRFKHGICNDKRFQALHFGPMLYQMFIIFGINGKFIPEGKITRKFREVHINVFKMYFMLKVKSSYTSANIALLENQTAKTMKLIRKFYKKHINANTKTFKYHKQIHYKEMIEKFGSPINFSSG